MRSAIMVNDGVKVVKSSGKAVDKLDCPPDVQPPRAGPRMAGAKRAPLFVSRTEASGSVHFENLTHFLTWLERAKMYKCLAVLTVNLLSIAIFHFKQVSI